MASTELWTSLQNDFQSAIAELNRKNDLYPDDFTKRYHSIAYGMDQETLYLSVGLLNTSYREEYSFWVNSKDTVIATWRPNVTYLPEQPDMVWKFTGNFKS